jgi:hypothetical protein
MGEGFRGKTVKKPPLRGERPQHIVSTAFRALYPAFFLRKPLAWEAKRG